MAPAAHEFVVFVVDPEVLLVADVDQTVVASQPSEWTMLSSSTFPRMMACSVAFAQLGTTSV